MPVRIYFRGLILFQFDKKKRLVAELISDPRRKGKTGAAPGPDDHEPEIQVATGEDFRHLLDVDANRAFQQATRAIRTKSAKVNEAKRRFAKKATAFRTGASASVPIGADIPNIPHLLLPRRLNDGFNVEISVPDNKTVGVTRARSFDDYVPDVNRLARMAKLRTLKKLTAKKLKKDYVRNTVTVDCGTIGVSEVVMWDAGYSMDELDPVDRPSSPATIKFMGVDFRGHAAIECMILVPHDTVTIRVTDSKDQPVYKADYNSSGGPNQLAPENATEIMIQNYEYQRSQPVPWGMDFQWLFARRGYGTVDLGAELDAFRSLPRARELARLLKEDSDRLLKGRKGRPFPYIVSNVSVTRLTPLSPLTGTQSRPRCVQGTTSTTSTT